jgi:Ricin-type beta-trefoil lectin domain
MLGRRMRQVLSAALITTAALLTLGISARASGDEYGFTWFNHQNHYCMDVKGGTGTLVWSYPCNNSAAQTWFTEYDPNTGWYLMRNLATNKCLRVLPYTGNGDGQRATLDLCYWTYSGNLWHPYTVYSHEGYSYIAWRNLASWYCLDAGSGAYQSLKQWQCINYDYWQYWVPTLVYYGPP